MANEIEYNIGGIALTRGVDVKSIGPAAQSMSNPRGSIAPGKPTQHNRIQTVGLRSIGALNRQVVQTAFLGAYRLSSCEPRRGKRAHSRGSDQYAVAGRPHPRLLAQDKRWLDQEVVCKDSATPTQHACPK
jgi:hypothetical protein